MIDINSFERFMISSDIQNAGRLYCSSSSKTSSKRTTFTSKGSLPEAGCPKALSAGNSRSEPNEGCGMDAAGILPNGSMTEPLYGSELRSSYICSSHSLVSLFFIIETEFLQKNL